MGEKKIKLEVICTDINSVHDAILGGADRIELCQSLGDGGVTPSYGLIRNACSVSTIPIHVLIRPRAGDFTYTDDEIQVIIDDIEVCKKFGASGVVVGFLTEKGVVDKDLTIKIITHARPLSVTFHRAFDVTKNPLQALEDIIDAGCDRILTSGQAATAEEGQALITELVKVAQGKIIILAGSGVTDKNVAELIKVTGVSEVHASCKKIVKSNLTSKLKMGQAITLDLETVQAICNQLI